VKVLEFLAACAEFASRRRPDAGCFVHSILSRKTRGFLLGLAFRVSLPGLPSAAPIAKNRYGWYQVVLHLLIVDHGCFFFHLPDIDRRTVVVRLISCARPRLTLYLAYLGAEADDRKAINSRFLRSQRPAIIGRDGGRHPVSVRGRLQIGHETPDFRALPASRSAYIVSLRKTGRPEGRDNGVIPG